MKKRLATLVMSATVFGAIMLPASPAQASHCRPMPGGPPHPDEVRHEVACRVEHVFQCVSGLIRGDGCLIQA
jgi:hypothetical protein